MYRKDLITAEIERLAQVLARILALRLDNKSEEAKVLADEAYFEGFNLPVGILDEKNHEIFRVWLKDSGLSPAKLDLLSEFMYYELGQNKDRNKTIAAKLDFVYTMLSEKHKIVHLVNHHRQEIIKQYL